MTVSSIAVAIIGGGPAGIAAAIAAAGDGSSVMLVERDKRLGGRLRQSIHDGFGYMRYENVLTGPEYAYWDIDTLEQTNAVVLLQTNVTRIVKTEDGFQLTLSNRFGITIVDARAVVLTTGCRERTFSETGIFGTRSSGIYTAGTVQYFMNVLGQIPAKKCIVLGSDNLTLTTVRRMALSGIKIIGVYEPGSSPKGYLDYVSRCVFDFEIPFHLEHTITRVHGAERLQAVELAKADKSGKPIRGSEKVSLCDTLMISNGFVPYSELADLLDVPTFPDTGWPVCDQNCMTMTDGVFIAGNALFISDLVDYVTESGEIAGRAAARYIGHERRLVEVNAGRDFTAYAPHYINVDMLYGETAFFFNPAASRRDITFRVFIDNNEVFTHTYDYLRRNETQRVGLDLIGILTPESRISLRLD